MCSYRPEFPGRRAAPRKKKTARNNIETIYNSITITETFPKQLETRKYFIALLTTHTFVYYVNKTLILTLRSNFKIQVLNTFLF